jgi:hypothetical protein
MFRLEMFDGTKTYMFPNGAIATPEEIRRQFPAVDTFPHVLEVNGNVLQAVMEFAAVRQQAGIPDSETDENALMAMSMALTIPPVPAPPTVEERLAAAAEFQNLMSLEDEVK